MVQPLEPAGEVEGQLISLIVQENRALPEERLYLERVLERLTQRDARPERRPGP